MRHTTAESPEIAKDTASSNEDMSAWQQYRELAAEDTIDLICGPSQLLYRRKICRGKKLCFNRWVRAHIGANLAYGSASTSFDSGGFFLLNYNQLHQKIRLAACVFFQFMIDRRSICIHATAQVHIENIFS